MNSMYLPKHFSKSEAEDIQYLVEQNAFATVLSFPQNERPFINHLPVIYSPYAGEEGLLIGHMAKANPQWRQFQNNPESTLIFQGAHTYVTPTWYRSGRDVPTWNYAVVHMHGKMELVETFAEQIKVLKALTGFFEAPNPRPWAFELPDDLLEERALTGAIISFKFRPEKVEAKFKMSQNRSSEDRLGIIEGLKERNDDQSAAVRSLMEKSEKSR